MKISKGLGGMGVVAMSEQSKPHPASHFEPDETHIKKMDDGSFSIRHDMKLKKKHSGKEGYHGSYPDPKTATASTHAELMTNLKNHFGGKAKAATESEPDAEDMAEGGEEDE